MVPDFISVSAVDFWNNELDVLRDQLALLPCDGLAGLIASPDLLAIRIGLPKCDTVLFGHIAAFRQHFDVWDYFSTLKITSMTQVWPFYFNLLVCRFFQQKALGQERSQ